MGYWRCSKVETNKIKDVKRYEENLESLYLEKEASSTALTISSFNSDLESPQEKGKTIKLTVNAQGGSGKIEYCFVEKINDDYKEIKAYSETNTVLWQPQYVGTYTIYAVAKDSTGSMKISSMDYKIQEIEIPIITSFTADKASPQVSGTKINLTAEANGSGTLQYKFLIRDDKGNWYVIRNYGASNTVVWTTGATGNKTLYVDVKDSTGNVVRKEMIYKVTEKSTLTVSSFTADKASPQATGTKVTLKAEASGSGTLQYKFLIRDDKGNWYVIKDYGASNTVAWTTGATGNKTLYVDVKDSNGKVVRKEMSYKVIKPEFTVTFKNYDGTVLKVETVISGDSALSPNVPQRDGYVFSKWDKSFDKVTSDLEITALYNKIINPTIAIGDVVATLGETVQVPVTIYNNPGINGIQLNVSYDSKLILIEAQNGTALPSLNLTLPGSYSNPSNFLWDGMDENECGNGIVLNLTFKVPSTAKPGDRFVVSATYYDGTIYDMDLNDVKFDTINGAIVIK